tara:strand:- start:812 stop:997 length:186 start_codon:yes stop_codon:yes gene_type:complete
MMRRAIKRSSDDYINIRISQLVEDREKAHDQHDKMWYTRLIQELSWVLDNKQNCSLKNLGI